MNSTSPILCPLDKRRSRVEILVKLFVVYFTVIVAFCHLMSIRREPLLSPRPLFFVRGGAALITAYEHPNLTSLGPLSIEHAFHACCRAPWHLHYSWGCSDSEQAMGIETDYNTAPRQGQVRRRLLGATSSRPAE
jgi:hypothetical protein